MNNNNAGVNPRLLAITGNAGTGKSFLVDDLEGNWGFKFLSYDTCVAQVLQIKHVQQHLDATFGGHNKEFLRDLVFDVYTPKPGSLTIDNDKYARRELYLSYIKPIIKGEFNSSPLLLAEVPMLYELGWHDAFLSTCVCHTESAGPQLATERVYKRWESTIPDRPRLYKFSRTEQLRRYWHSIESWQFAPRHTLARLSTQFSIDTSTTELYIQGRDRLLDGMRAWGILRRS